MLDINRVVICIACLKPLPVKDFYVCDGYLKRRCKKCVKNKVASVKQKVKGKKARKRAYKQKKSSVIGWLGDDEIYC